MTAMLYALVAALANVAGGLAAAQGARWGRRMIALLVAFGAGFMLAVAIVDMLPEAIALGGAGAAGFVLLGYMLVHLTQHTVTPHFHFGEETHDVSRAAGVTALVGLLLHTFFDGVAIASGFAVSQALGILLFAAIFLHKLPEGLTITSMQIAAGVAPRRAVASAGLLGAATVVGVLVTDAIAFLGAHGLALSAGVTVYVGASNLVPEFQAKRGLRLPVAFFLGVAAYYAGRWALARAGLG